MYGLLKITFIHWHVCSHTQMAETTIQSANCFLEGETFTHPWLCLCRQSNRCSSAHGCFTSWATVSGVAEVRVQHCSYFQLNILIWTWRGCLCCSALTWKGETNCWQTKNLRCNKAFMTNRQFMIRFFSCAPSYITDYVRCIPHLSHLGFLPH